MDYANPNITQQDLDYISGLVMLWMEDGASDGTVIAKMVDAYQNAKLLNSHISVAWAAVIQDAVRAIVLDTAALEEEVTVKYETMIIKLNRKYGV